MDFIQMDPVEFEKKFTRACVMDGRPFVVDRKRRADLIFTRRHWLKWMAEFEKINMDVDQTVKAIFDTGRLADTRRYAGDYNGRRIRWEIHEYEGVLWRGWDTWERLGLPEDTEPVREELGARLSKLEAQARICLFAGNKHLDVIKAAMEREMFEEAIKLRRATDRMHIRLFDIGGSIFAVRWIPVRGGGWRFEHMGTLPEPVKLDHQDKFY